MTLKKQKNTLKKFMANHFKISNIHVGDNFPPVVISEIGINHNGSLDFAIQLCDSAIKAGAKIIKHQTHIADKEMSIEAKKIVPGNSKKNIYNIIKSCQLSYDDELKMAKFVRQRKAIYISSPFSREAVDRLCSIKVPAFKIGSGECNNYPLVEYICKKKKPIILSTGMNDIRSIKKTVNIIRKYKLPYALMHCTNIYPTPNKLVRLNCLNDLKKNFPDAVIGLSDHTTSNYSCYAAVALGARIIEKHYIDKKSRIGPDVSCSMDQLELQQMIEGTKAIFDSMQGKKKSLNEEKKTINFAFASIAATKNIKIGEKITKANIFPLRPATGYFKVKDYEKILGKVAKNNIKKNYQLKFSDIY
jgi:N-acetylneuraminate synthase